MYVLWESLRSPVWCDGQLSGACCAGVAVVVTICRCMAPLYAASYVTCWFCTSMNDSLWMTFTLLFWQPQVW